MTFIGWSVVKENGSVSQAAGRSRRTVWARCSECGPTAPVITWVPYREEHSVIFAGEPRLGVQPDVFCSGCWREVSYRESLTPPDAAQRHEECNQRCLNGKTICRCACEGRCHGEGKCHCAVFVSGAEVAA